MTTRSLGMTSNQNQLKENRNYLHQASMHSRMMKILFLMNNYIFLFFNIAFYFKMCLDICVLKTFDNGRRERRTCRGSRTGDGRGRSINGTRTHRCHQYLADKCAQNWNHAYCYFIIGDMVLLEPNTGIVYLILPKQFVCYLFNWKHQI